MKNPEMERRRKVGETRRETSSIFLRIPGEQQAPPPAESNSSSPVVPGGTLDTAAVHSVLVITLLTYIMNSSGYQCTYLHATSMIYVLLTLFAYCGSRSKLPE